MESLRVNNLTAFVPSKNFQLSCKFYEDLGFNKIVDIGSAFRYEINGCSFWLQNYYTKVWADNCMLCLHVDNIDHWYKKIVELDFDNNYGGLAKVCSEPHADDHGSVIMNIIDPSGVLWHIYQGT